MSVDKLREEMNSTVRPRIKELRDKMEDEDRDWTSEDEKDFEEVCDRFDNLKAQIERYEKTDSMQDWMDAPQDKAPPKGSDDVRHEPDKVELRDSVTGEHRSVELPPREEREARKSALRRYLVGGSSSLSAEESRILQQDSSTKGGYLSPGKEFMAELIKDIDNTVFVRDVARVLPPLTSADSLGVPSLDTDLGDADWTTELSTGDADDMDFGQRELNPHPAAKLVKASKTLLRKGSMSVDSLVRDRMSYKFGVTQEKAYLTGSGSQQPLGVFTSSEDGIDDSRDVSEDNNTTSVTADGLMNALYSLKEGYQANAVWCFHRDAIKQIRKLKDSNDQYLWSPFSEGNEPGQILDHPYRMSEYAPNTFTSDSYVGIIGDWSYYWIVDALTFTVQVLLERYAENNQNGYIGRYEGDGMPVLAEAFARVQLA